MVRLISLLESVKNPDVWYHGSDRPITKFLYSKIGQSGRSVTQYHGYGLYFIHSSERAKTYGSIITKMQLSPNADILHEKVTPAQLRKIYNQLKRESKLREGDADFYGKPTYGEYSVLTDVYEFYIFFLRAYRQHFSDMKDVSDFLARAGIDGMRVLNDVNDDILVIFNDNVINVVK